MLNASFSQTISSQTYVNIAVEQFGARQLNDDGILQEKKSINSRLLLFWQVIYLILAPNLINMTSFY